VPTQLPNLPTSLHTPLDFPYFSLHLIKEK
jgi:hypothetical protein